MTALLVTASVLGWWAWGGFLVKTLLWKQLRDTCQTERARSAVVLIAMPLTWYLGQGVRGLVVSWGYYLGYPGAHVLWLTGVLGVAGFFATVQVFSKSKPSFKAPSLPRFSGPEYALIAVLLVVSVNFAWRAINPWYENDESLVYGYFAKAIANGWVFTDFIAYKFGHHYGPKMIEALDAQLFAVNFDPLLAKIFRFANLVMSGFLLSGFVFCAVGVARLWAIALFVLLLAVPELAHLGVSLKIDAMVMGFEIAALVALFLALLNRKSDAALNLSGAALFLSLCGFASRQSGLYLAVLCSLVFASFAIKRPRWPIAALATIALWAICSVGYIYNYKAFGNPLYPFQAPGPFSSGQYVFTLDHYRGYLNLKFLPPVLNEFYLLIHLALGFEVRPHLTFLPHAPGRSLGMIWLSPAMLAIFAAPFFIKQRTIAILTAVFIYLYVFWTQGVHFSRVFIAASMIPVTIAVLIASLRASSLEKSQRAVQKLVVMGLAATLLMGAYYITKYSKRYPHTWAAAYSSEARFASDVALLESLGEKNIPNKNEIELLTEKLRSLGKVRTGATTFSGRWVSILLKHGFIVDSHHQYDANAGDLEQIYRYIHCVLIDSDFALRLPIHREFVSGTFPRTHFESQDKKWRLQCRN